MPSTSNAAGEPIAGSDPRSGVCAELLDVTEVAGLLHCSPRHIYRLADAGKLPRPLKLGSLVRWRRAEILAWIAEGCPPVRQVRGGGR